MLKTLEKRTEAEKALSAVNGDALAQSLDRTERVYCETHGLVKSVWGHCEECYDAGYRDWDATRIAKTLIPEWTGINVDGRQVIVAPVRDALEAVQAIGRYKHSNVDALILIVWDRLITALDHGRIGPSWTLQDADDDSNPVTCARCGQDFTPVWGDERVCDECWLAENGPPHR